MGEPVGDSSKSLEKAEAKMTALGLPRPGKPPDAVEGLDWPENVADLSPEELAHHLTWWSGWSSYARYHLGRAETNYSAYSRDFDTEMKTRLYKSSGDHRTVTDAKAAITQMPDMVNMAKKQQEAEALVLLLKSLLQGYEDKYSTVSREVSRRGQDFRETSGSGKDRYHA